ncbi:GNAT family N-acetyltransferase [Silvibacterium sp.]|uniref:GNAT family N-acetyltransferase n=1 Tax=Silvibacterium sp. TaxID=1964179 RepID=UPI0039E5C13D
MPLPVSRTYHGLAGLGSCVQGLFASRPFSFAAATSGAVQRKPASRPGVDSFQVDLRPKSGGWPLPRDVQAKMEAALGANFSDVRIHVGPEASSIGAIAFTWGSDIHFAPGQYSPHTPHGQFLLGHELTHVVQQRAGRVANPFGSGVAVVQDQALEAEADRLGKMASMSRAHEQAAVPATQAQEGCASGSCGAVLRKVALQRKAEVPRYTVRPAMRSGSGWRIDVAPLGAGQPVGSLQLTPSRDGLFLSNLKVEQEHRRHGIAGQLIDAALMTARSNGYRTAQLEARPDSPADISTGALVSMYRRMGFSAAGITSRGNPLMERAV